LAGLAEAQANAQGQQRNSEKLFHCGIPVILYLLEDLELPTRGWTIES
jgi:hypothetical protein